MKTTLGTFRDRKCFITGAASGIGRSLAVATARAGADLFLTDVNEVALKTVVNEIRAAGGQVSVHRALDISNFEAVRTLAEEIHAEVGAMDVLMNVAGISIWGTVENLEHDHWRRLVDVNLMGPIHVIECFVPNMIAAKRGGHLVNVSSAAGLFGLPWHAAYSATKFGLRGISEVLRFDLEQHGIGVSLVCPGAVDTGLVNTIEIVGIDTSSAEVLKMKEHFRGRAVTPDKAAEAILRGVLRNDYLVFTSNDIRVGHWFQNKLAFLYEGAMRRMNARMSRLAARNPRK